MKNEDVIIAFLKKERGTSQSLKSSKIKLFSYSTCIAQWEDHHVLINPTSYTGTMDRNLTLLYKIISTSDIIYKDVSNYVPKECNDLIKYKIID